jgi:hypothetical protein
METTRLEPLVGSSGLKEESQRIPTIDSEIVQPGNLPAIPARPSSPAESAAQVRAVTPPPAIRPPLAPSATESATGQFVQLGPIDEPMHKPGLGISSAAAAMAVLRSSQPQSPAQPPAVPFDRPSPGPYSLSGPELLSGPSDPASMDPTIEMPLPIFEAIESEWFRSAPRPTPLLEPDPVIAPRPAAAASASVPFAPPQTATTPVERPAAGSGLPIRTPGQPVSPAPKQDAPAASFTPPPAAPAAPRPAPAPVPAEAPAADERQRVNPMSVSGRPVPATERPTDRPASVPPAAPVPGRDRETVSSSPNGSSAKPPITVVPPVSAVPTASPAAAAPITPSGDAQRWSSPADAGWKAAQAAAEVQPDLATGSGLPKRVPMAHFVPGRVEPPKSKTPRSTVHRSPDAVRGVLSSYRHGLEQGRQATQAKHAVATEKNDEQEEM